MTAFSQAAAVGKVLTEWMANGDPGLDFFMWDVTRYGEWAGRAYTKARTADMYSTRFQTHYPYEDREAGRPVRTTPIYPLLKDAGAVFGASWGYEYPLWFAPEGAEARDELTFRRPNWFGPVGEEARAVRAALGLFETSIYGKFSVRGPRAGEWLDQVMANRMPRENGRIVLTPMLNEAGRLIGDFSVTRLGPEEFFLVGAGATERFHLRWWERFLPAEGVTLESMMTRLAGFAIAGPRSRALLARLAERDVSNDALPFFTGARMPLGPAPEVIVLRVSYSGELGYELYLPPEHQIPLLLALREAGADLGLRRAGMRALGLVAAGEGVCRMGTGALAGLRSLPGRARALRQARQGRVRRARGRVAGRRTRAGRTPRALGDRSRGRRPLGRGAGAPRRRMRGLPDLRRLRPHHREDPRPGLRPRRRGDLQRRLRRGGDRQAGSRAAAGTPAGRSGGEADAGLSGGGGDLPPEDGRERAQPRRRPRGRGTASRGMRGKRGAGARHRHPIIG